MKKILITGGPVHAYLDPVKIITNRFRGGRMVQLAEEFAECVDLDITYLTTKQSVQPNKNVCIVHHDGFDDYMAKVKSLAAEQDAVILGAAVANLIPKKPLDHKFPSHNYSPGDIIPIDFIIAPRVIDEVKSYMKPHAHLFGFKLLAGTKHEILIDAAYDIVLESGATAVFANDVINLDTKYAVAKDKSVTRLHSDKMVSWIEDILFDQYYSTEIDQEVSWNVEVEEAKKQYQKYMLEYSSKCVVHEHNDKKISFGTIATRIKNTNSFITTTRGKKEFSIDECTKVTHVDHDGLIVYIEKHADKATMNAPLLHWIFKINRNVKSIVHYHQQLEYLDTQEWASPGTLRDSCRRHVTQSFNIRGHGCVLLFDHEGNMLK